MPPGAALPSEVADRFVWREWRNAIAVLRGAYPTEWDEILDVLSNFQLRRSWLEQSGGNLTQISKHIDTEFRGRGWEETKFATQVTVAQQPKNGANPTPVTYDSPTHKVDCFKNHVGVEMEWNNKDTFFDRDLNNFRLLFDLRMIGVGVIITRGEDLKSLAIKLGRQPGTYGATTTHWNTLVPRMEGGGGGGCPILAFAITEKCYDPDS